MNWDTFLWTTLGVGLTLSTFSFLYRDNPFYRFSESLYVGVSAGYFSMILWYNGLVPTLIDRLWIGQPWWQIWGGKWWYVIPGILGLMMWFRFSKKKSWISRYPIAFYLGIATGAAIPLEMQNRVNRQMYDTIRSVFETVNSGQSVFSGVNDLIIFVGVLCGLFYFFFSLAHKGPIGGVAKVGIYFLMVGFGASFGYTVMGRISLFIQRVQYVRDWFDMGFGGSGGAAAIVWIIILLMVLLVLLEIIRQVTKKPTQQTT